MYFLLVISLVLQQGCYGENEIEFNHVIKNVMLLSSPLEIFEVEDEYFCMFECVTYRNICKSVNFNPIHGICLLLDITILEITSTTAPPTTTPTTTTPPTPTTPPTITPTTTTPSKLICDEIGCYYRAYDKHNNNIICYTFEISGYFLIPKDGIVKGFQLVHYNGSFSCGGVIRTGKRIWGCNEKEQTRISAGWHTLGRDHVTYVDEKQITFLIDEIDFQFLDYKEDAFVWKRSAFKNSHNQCVKVYVIYANDQTGLSDIQK